MGLKCGIVGLPNVGKSTLFNSMSNSKAQAANFPFCTIEPNVGMIIVPDKRIEKLAELVNPAQTVFANIEIVDIAGLVKGASKGEGLGNKFLANINETDAIIHVLRCFDDENITHVDTTINPVRDKEIIDTELQLKDLEMVENRLSKLKKQAVTGKQADALARVKLLEQIQATLEMGKSVRTLNFSDEEQKIVNEFQLLTAKPVLYVCNVDSASVKNGNTYTKAVETFVKDEGAEMILLDAATESDLAEFDDYEEKLMFLEEMGLEEPALNRLITSAYKLLDLQTYFTAGPKEVKAWTFKRGTKAPQAAGIIHSDFEKGFIRAEVIKYDDYVHYGSEQACREAGKIAVEGKDYVVQDGDIMHFRFNV
jgi:GTP-binding protein YchF